MNINEFKTHLETSLRSFSPTEGISTDQLKLEALIQLNTSIHSHLEKTSVGTLLEILNMEDSWEKLRMTILWDIAQSGVSPDELKVIIKLIDQYLIDVAK